MLIKSSCLASLHQQASNLHFIAQTNSPNTHIHPSWPHLSFFALSSYNQTFLEHFLDLMITFVIACHLLLLVYLGLCLQLQLIGSVRPASFYIMIQYKWDKPYMEAKVFWILQNLTFITTYTSYKSIFLYRRECVLPEITHFFFPY